MRGIYCTALITCLQLTSVHLSLVLCCRCTWQEPSSCHPLALGVAQDAQDVHLLINRNSLYSSLSDHSERKTAGLRCSNHHTLLSPWSDWFHFSQEKTENKCQVCDHFLVQGMHPHFHPHSVSLLLLFCQAFHGTTSKEKKKIHFKSVDHKSHSHSPGEKH